ncbi:unnamed protein product [Lactuca virosa]|uniref:Uncharacterized protein n=1 Tax=Lactuca virosa TaxID=75947 RepID=A0AAU9LJQ0_9ASTR|nr:unnamed protein product [Lactuca virosa]
MHPSWSSSPAIQVVSVSAIIIIFIFFRKYVINKTTSNQPGLPPGPTPLPFICCTIQMLLNRPTFRWIHKLIDQFNTPILCIKLGPSTHVIAVSSPNLACEFMRKQDVVFSSRPETLSTYLVSDRFFGAGMEDGGPGEEETEHVASVFIILKYLYTFSISDFFPWLRGKTDFEGHQKIIRTAIQRVRKYQDPLIDERIQMWKDGVRKVKKDVLDVLINHESPKLTDQEIKARILVRLTCKS